MDWVPICQLFSLIVKEKIAKNGTSDITLRPRELDLLTIYIWNQSHLGIVVSTSIWTHPFLCSCQANSGIFTI